MSMTKKDFELIAGVVERSNEIFYHDKVKIAALLADALASTNPLFDRNKFLTACGVMQ